LSEELLGFSFVSSATSGSNFTFYMVCIAVTIAYAIISACSFWLICPVSLLTIGLGWLSI
jgi:hypothetical protein